MMSSVKYENWVISELLPGSEKCSTCLTVEKTWKPPYSHTVDKSSVWRWEPEGWPAPDGAGGRTGTVDLEQRNIDQ